MRALLVHAFADPPAPRLEEIAEPQPGPRDLLIRVEASGVNPVDAMFASGRMEELVPRQLPFVLGWECAGTIEAVGDEVTRFAPGDRVLARPDPTRGGTLAELVAVDEAEAAPWPASLAAVAAGALPLAGLTAMNLVVTQGGLRRGERVLILGAAGGVGHLAVQMAKLHGAHVLATAAARDGQAVRSLGADEVYDYADADWAKRIGEVDLIADCVGPQALGLALPVLRKGGRVRSVVAPPAISAPPDAELDGAFVYAPPDGGMLAELAALAADGALRPMAASVLPADRAGEAIAALGARRRPGKVVVLFARSGSLEA